MKKPEVQLHSAITLVWSGDPYGITKEARKDKTEELTQLAIQWPPQKFGSVSKSEFDAAMKEMKFRLWEKMRAANITKRGE